MRRINRCLNPRLVEICQRNIQLEELNVKLHAYLPAPLNTHCQIGSFNKGCLVIVVNDAAWASQLRYMLPELRDKLRKEAGIYQLSSINISIIPEISSQQSTKKIETPKLSAKARAVIMESEKQCSYQPLREALYKLAKEKSDEDTLFS